MASQKQLRLPSIPSDSAIGRSKKMALKRDVIQWLTKKKVGWSSDIVTTVGLGFVNTLTNSLWYVDGHHHTIESRACQFPVEFKEFQGYNKPEVTKHRRRDAENMCTGMLDSYSVMLNRYLIQPWFSLTAWKPLKDSVLQLADSMNKYAIYLKEKNATVQANHSMLEPVRSPSEAESFCLVKGAQWVKPTVAAQFDALQKHIDSVEEFVPVLINDFAPADARCV